MSMLIEKRQEIASKLEALEKARIESIRTKLDIYRVQLEAEPESEDIKKARAVLEAIDAVILYEAETEPKAEPAVEPVPVVEEPKAEPAPIVEETKVEATNADISIVAEAPAKEEVVVEVKVDADNNVSVKPAELEPRPGMAYVGIPERR